ncbi:MAG: hypothetical protein FK734_12220 [Asgard group archaeon]|nr:hypothetical protein [Asgard group archaeon]
MKRLTKKEKKKLLFTISALRNEDKLLQKHIADFYSKKDENTLQLLIKALRDNDLTFRFDSIKALGLLRNQAKEAVPALIKIVQKDTKNSKLAIWALGEIGDKSAVPILLKMKDEHSLEVAEALVKIGNHLNVAKLILSKVLNDNIGKTRCRAARALGTIGEEVVPILANACKRGDDRINICIFDIFKEMGGKAIEAVPILIEKLKGKDYSHNAIYPLIEIAKESDEVIPLLIDSIKNNIEYYSFSNKIFDTLSRIGKKAVPALINLLYYEDDVKEGFRAKVASTLVQIGEKEAIPDLLDSYIMKQNNKSFSTISIEIAEFVCKSDNLKIVLTALAHLITKGYYKIAFWALEKIVEMDDYADETVPILLNQFESITDNNIYKEAIYTLGKLEEKAAAAIPFLLSIFKMSNSPLDEAIVWSLGQMGKDAYKAVNAIAIARNNGNYAANGALTSIAYSLGFKNSNELFIEMTYNAILELLPKFQAEIPVSLIRIAELVPYLHKQDIESILQNILFSYPELGIYMPLEQVFIRKKDTEELFEELIANPSKITKHFTCFFCGDQLNHNEKQYCVKCNKEILFCSICKLPINYGLKVGKCPKCHNEAHLSHLQEWLKVKGTCPVCLQPLPIEGIVPLEELDLKKKKN